MNSEARVPALDGLRGVAIILVMLCHFIPSYPASSGLVGGFMARPVPDRWPRGPTPRDSFFRSR